MSLIEIRQIVTTVEEVWHEGGPRAETPLLRGAVCAVIRNPYAGRYEPDIMPLMEDMNGLGVAMSKRLVAALGVEPDRVESYGKGAIVGEDGELEHGALWHAPGGYAMREVLGKAKAIVPSTKKVGGLGARLDVPLHHKDAAYVRSHYSAIEVGVPAAPRRHEMIVALVMATGPRIHARVGGLKASEIKVGDGQR